MIRLHTGSTPGTPTSNSREADQTMDRKLLLVYPKSPPPCYLDIRAAEPLVRRSSLLLHAGLATVAALTPAEFRVRIIDANLEPIDFDEPYDIVGISGHQFHTESAREIAEAFRGRGALIVCGGPAVSITPEKFRPFSDVLIIGEAERIWPRFLQDYLEGRHEPAYRETERFDLSISPVPDYSSFEPSTLKRYMSGIVQTSRGCPWDCEYCAAITYLGRKVRRKPIGTVLEELDQLHRLGLRFVWLVDDNFSAGRRQAKALLKAIRAWNRAKRHPMALSASLSLETARDVEFLELAAEAGLTRVSIGIGSPDEASLEEANKLQNLRRDIGEDVRVFHEHGILVSGGCMVGFDNDDISIFQRQFDFFTDIGVAEVRVYPVQALEGTRLKDRMASEGRWNDWDRAAEVGRKLAGDHFVPSLFNVVTFVPRRMTPAQLRQGSLWLLAQFNRLDAHARRLQTFFSNYEASPRKERLSIPHGPPTLEDLGMALRVLRSSYAQASPLERKAIKDLLRTAQRSSHPQRFSFVIGALLAVKNNRAMLDAHGVDPARIEDPGRAT